MSLLPSNIAQLTYAFPLDQLKSRTLTKTCLRNPYHVSRMIKDDREKTKPERSVFAEKDLTDKVDSYWGRA